MYGYILNDKIYRSIYHLTVLFDISFKSSSPESYTLIPIYCTFLSFCVLWKLSFSVLFVQATIQIFFKFGKPPANLLICNGLYMLQSYIPCLKSTLPKVTPFHLGCHQWHGTHGKTYEGEMMWKDWISAFLMDQCQNIFRYWKCLSKTAKLVIDSVHAA